jgi:hypothetical protein
MEVFFPAFKNTRCFSSGRAGDYENLSDIAKRLCEITGNISPTALPFVCFFPPTPKSDHFSPSLYLVPLYNCCLNHKNL